MIFSGNNFVKNKNIFNHINVMYAITNPHLVYQPYYMRITRYTLHEKIKKSKSREGRIYKIIRGFKAKLKLKI